eukprot:TRINITY_DN5868_c0_g1_i2.p1 TRINITY_DN5868_c0_g1~~TRINITY_DN5868_c0_g1_i2.p1  ORF type:complete len:374 (+),score=48.83 TRINITY_DN5868_c0_g1_i2:85-1122(+)
MLMLLFSTMYVVCLGAAELWSDTPNATLVIVGRVINGFGGDGFALFGQAVILQQFGNGPNEALAMGVLFAVMSGLGSGLSYVLFGFLIEYLGLLWALCALLLWVVAGWVLLTMYFHDMGNLFPDAGIESPTESPRMRRQVSPLSTDKNWNYLDVVCRADSILIFSCTVCVIGGFQYTVVNYLPSALSNHSGSSVSGSDSVSGVIYFIIAILPPLLGLLMDKLEGVCHKQLMYMRVILFGMLLAMVAQYALYAGILPASVCAALIGVALAPVEMTMTLFIMQLCESTKLDVNTALGLLQQLAVSLGVMVTPLLISLSAVEPVSYSLLGAGLLVGLVLLAQMRSVKA